MTAEPDTGPDGPPRAMIIAAVAVAVVTVGVILAIAATRQGPGRPVAMPTVPAPKADSAECRSLVGALPQRLGDYQRVALAQPAPPGSAAWRGGADGQPVSLRCGLDRPGDFVVGSPIQVVDRVQWFETAAERQSSREAGGFTWYAVDRPVYVALTLPPDSGPTPIQQLSEVIDRTLKAVPIDPAPPR